MSPRTLWAVRTAKNFVLIYRQPPEKLPNGRWSRVRALWKHEPLTVQALHFDEVLRVDEPMRLVFDSTVWHEVWHLNRVSDDAVQVMFGSSAPIEFCQEFLELIEATDLPVGKHLGFHFEPVVA